MFLLTLAVWLYMYVRRIAFIKAVNPTQEQLAPLEFARLSPPQVSNPSDNLKNLFELPIVFYGLAIYLFVTKQVDMIYVAAAWVFVVFRALHSIVHCTANIVIVRFYLYLVAAGALWFMALRAAFNYFK